MGGGQRERKDDSSGRFLNGVSSSLFIRSHPLQAYDILHWPRLWRQQQAWLYRLHWSRHERLHSAGLYWLCCALICVRLCWAHCVGCNLQQNRLHKTHIMLWPALGLHWTHIVLLTVLFSATFIHILQYRLRRAGAGIYMYTNTYSTLSKNLANFQEQGRNPLAGKFSQQFLGNEAMLPRIIGKFPILSRKSALLLGQCIVG